MNAKEIKSVLMSWIKTIPYEDSEGSLKKAYDRIKGSCDQIDQILLAHSLRPHTLTGHMSLYKNVLHHSNNTLPKWYFECIGIYVSMLNQCDYCVEHHKVGMHKLLNDEHKFKSIVAALSSELTNVFDEKLVSGLQYAKSLTLQPSEVSKNLFDDLLEKGFSHGEILEINQVTAYFNYANRTVLGLGVTTQGEELGMSPNGEGDEEWGHV